MDRIIHIKFINMSKSRFGKDDLAISESKNVFNTYIYKNAKENKL